MENSKPAPELCDERARLTRREQRYDRYQQVMAFYEQGLGFTEITGRVELIRRTIERWIKAGDFPETKRRRKRRSVFDPYATYVLWRWEQGCTNGLQLWQEIKAKGYQGSAQTVYRYLRSLRKKLRIIWKPEVPPAPLQDFSAHDAVWLFAHDPDSLDEKEQETLMSFVRRARRLTRPTSWSRNFGISCIIGREGSLMHGWRKVPPARSANYRALSRGSNGTRQQW